MWTTLIPSVIGFLGVLAGAWLVRSNERQARKLEFVEKQLHELYSPLYATRKEIRSLSELRVRVADAADSAWRELCEDQPQGAAPDFSRFRKVIEYENEQLKEVLLPGYERMLNTLRENLYLAEESTRQHLPTLIEYLEIWRRHLNKSIPGEVTIKLGHTEAKLDAFYTDVERTFAELREKLAAGDASSQWLEVIFQGLRVKITKGG